MTQNNVFSSVDCWCLWKEPVFILADVQSDVFSPSRMPVTDFQLTNSFVADILWYACPCVNEALLQVAGVASFSK